MSKLNNWILESESWHKFKQFNLLEETVSDYDFIGNWDDFYISLMGRMDGILSDYLNDELINSDSAINIAKGLAIYGLKETKDKFCFVSRIMALIYSASLYYIGDMNSISQVILNNIEDSEINDFPEIDKLLLFFLSRKIKYKTQLSEHLYKFVETGNIVELNFLLKVLHEKKNKDGIGDYLSTKIAIVLIEIFKKNNVWEDLKEFATGEYNQDWKNYIKNNLTVKNIWNFFPSQRVALKGELLSSNNTKSLQMPTSAGKTAICELLIISEFIKNKNAKILFIVPLRALAYELKRSMCKNLSSFGVKCKVSYGGYSPTREDSVTIEKANVLIITPEKLASYETMYSGIYSKYTLTICDEGHLLGSDQRGLNYELLLSKLRKIENMRFIFLSAIIPNIEHIHTWLDKTQNKGNIIQSDYRPTLLSYGFHENNKIHMQSSKKNNYVLNHFIAPEDFNNSKIPKLNKSETAAILGLKSLITGTVAVFCSQVTRSGVYAVVTNTLDLLEKLSIPKPIDFTDKERIKELNEYFNIIVGSECLLSKSIQKGFLFHHGTLPQFIRELIEDYINKGWIKYFICTTTIAEGVNFPIKTLVLYNCKRFNGTICESLKIRDLINLFGRTGRARHETEGIVIASNPSDFNLVKKVINNEAEDVRSLLRYLTKALEAFFKKQKLEMFTNEWLDKQTNIRDLLDTIDLSIINMLPEELTEDLISQMVEELFKNTLTFQLANDDEKEIFRKLFNLRAEKIKMYIPKFSELKSSNVGIKDFELLNKLVNIEEELWTSPDANLNDIVARFTSLYKDFTGNKNFDIYANLLQTWINGGWYKEMASSINESIEHLFKILHGDFADFIKFVENVTSLLDKHAENNNLVLNENTKKATLLIEKGFNNILQIHLSDIGFTERLGNIALSEYLKKINYKYVTNDSLARFLKEHIKDMIPSLHIPTISKNKLMENIKFFNDN